MSVSTEMINIKGLTKSYGGVTVLKDMDFILHSGEVHCLVGENGAGKSTFIKALSGAIVPDSGSMTLFGKTYKRFKPRDTIALGVSTIYQDVDLVDSLTVADNIFLGHELNRYGVVDAKTQNQKAQALIDELNISMRADVLVDTLSPAQKQNLQIVKALHRKSRVLIMDEPTASLGEEESAALVKLIHQIKETDVGVIYISHHLEEIFDIADTVTVIKDGIVTGCFSREECTHELIIQNMVGRSASLFYDRERIEINADDTLLELCNISNKPLVNNVSLKVCKGEIVGIGGLVGSGRTELARIVFGVDQMSEGKIIKNGAQLQLKSPKHAIEMGICMLGEDRKFDGLFMDRSVLENICIASNEHNVLLSPAKDESSTQKMIETLSIRTSGLYQEIQFLSGGNQQKCLIARWMLSSCDLIIFDEPTKGVDIGAREDIYALMVSLAKDGKGIIMISSDMPELLSMSDRIYVMRDGSVTHEYGYNEKIDEERLLKCYMGIEH